LAVKSSTRHVEGPGGRKKKVGGFQKSGRFYIAGAKE